ncbi:monocarboxylate transporter 2-like isoform X3 [Amblyomma americanum]
MEVRKPESCQWSHWKWGTRLRQYGPDSVHSWLVAGACALASCFAMSVRRSSGLLFVAIQETFLTNKSDGSWPIMVMGAVMYLSGLITGPMAHKFTARPVIIAGAATSSIGAIISYIAPSIDVMTFTLGVVHGYFRDRVGAYDWLFVICGTLNLVGTAVWALVITLEARHKKNLKIQSADHTSKAADFMEIQNANKN